MLINLKKRPLNVEFKGVDPVQKAQFESLILQQAHSKKEPKAKSKCKSDGQAKRIEEEEDESQTEEEMEEEEEEMLDPKDGENQQSVVDFLLNRGRDESSNRYQVRQQEERSEAQFSFA